MTIEEKIAIVAETVLEIEGDRAIDTQIVHQIDSGDEAEIVTQEIGEMLPVIGRGDVEMILLTEVEEREMALPREAHLREVQRYVKSAQSLLVQPI